MALICKGIIEIYKIKFYYYRVKMYDHDLQNHNLPNRT